MPTMWQQIHFGFSPAVETYSEKDGLCVRPKLKIGEALAAEGTERERLHDRHVREDLVHEARELVDLHVGDAPDFGVGDPRAARQVGLEHGHARRPSAGSGQIGC